MFESISIYDFVITTCLFITIVLWYSSVQKQKRQKEELEQLNN